MKISKSKQELARIISENGGWSDGAEFAAQDKDGDAFKFDSKPVMGVSREAWMPTGNGRADKLCYCTTIKGWHQTILSRTEYFHLYPSPDADGWIEWKGGECPIGEGDRIDVKLSDGDEFFDVSSDCGWGANAGCCNIIAYRLHKPEVKPEFCESVTHGIPEPESIDGLCAKVTEENKHQHVDAKPTIEQLAADYRNAKDYADFKQQEVDDAKADADARLKTLELAGEDIGLLLSPINAKKEPELVIAVQAGDEVECVESNIKRNKYNEMVGRLHTIDESDTSTPYLVDFGNEARIWCHEVKFIRRP